MAYANTLSSAAPADTDLLSLGDDAIRVLAAALIERLLTVFADLNAQPMQLLLAAFPDGLITGAKLVDGTIPAAKLALAIGLRKIFYAASGTVTTTIAAAATFTYTFGIVGVRPGDAVVANMTVVQPLILQALILSNDTVTLYFYNPTAGSIPVSQVINVAVIQQTAVGL